jgi:predicted AlkP superfamily pyrophosphatase or phosphodiesterase
MKKKIALYVFIDAFGWEVYQKYGFLNQLLPHHRRLETTFGFSSAADPSILTGRYPNEHTHWSSFIYDPYNSPFKHLKLLSFLPPRIFDTWRVRHTTSKLIKKLKGYTGYFELYSVPFALLPLFDYLEKHDYFVPGGILKTDTIFDWCVQRDIPYYCSNWRHSEEQIIRENLMEISQGKINLAYIYLPKLDAVMHEFGPIAPQTEAKIHWLETQVTKIYNFTQKLYDEVSLYIISDHGMAPVTHGFDVMKVIADTGLTYGKDYVAFYDSTMARFWDLTGKSRAIITQALSTVSDGYILPDNELAEMHVDFPHTKFGEFFFLMNEGVLLNPSFMGKKIIAGMHGYHPQAAHSYSFIASNQVLSESINSITDIRKTMEMELVART